MFQSTRHDYYSHGAFTNAFGTFHSICCDDIAEALSESSSSCRRHEVKP